MKTAILLVDNDLGFVFWLGRLLDRSGYEAFPARNVHEALQLVADLHLTVDLLLVSDSLPDAGHLISTLRGNPHPLKVILLREKPELAADLDIDASYRKPAEHIDENTKQELLQFIDMTIAKRREATVH